MPTFSSYPRQDAFETTLPTDIDAVVTTIGLNLAPSFTLSSGTCYAVIDYDKPTTKIEIISFTGVSGSNLTGVTRGVAKYEGGGSTAQTHSSGAKVIISDNWQTWKDIATAINSKIDTTGGTITGDLLFSGASASFRTPNLTTAQKNAMSAPANGMLVYDTTLGELQQYNGGAWVTFSAGSTQPNASTTVAGKVEQATAAEVKAGTSTGGTGAPLFINPADSTVTSAGAADDGKVVKLNALGLIDPTTLTPTNSLTVSFTTGEAIDGSTTPMAVYLKAADGLIYKTVNNGTGEQAFQFIGFVTTNALISTSASVIIEGVVSGFTGLTKDDFLYLDTTAGTISNAPTGFSTAGYSIYQIGRAITTTSIIIEKGAKMKSGSEAFSTTAVANNDLTLDLGFKPRILEVDFYIQGHGTSTGTPYYTQSAGRFTTLGSTVVGAIQYGYTLGGGSYDNGPVATFNVAAADFTSATPACMYTGSTGSGTGGITMTLSVPSISNTGIVIRRATASNAPASTARANLIWRAYA